jgi:hypothetical protein
MRKLSSGRVSPDLPDRGCTLGLPVSGREPVAPRGACVRWYQPGSATGRPRCATGRRGSLPRCVAAGGARAYPYRTG